MRILIVLLLLLFVAMSGIGYYLSPDDLRSCDDRPTTDGCVPADAVIAISGGDTEARTEEAVRLYREGWAKQLIFSGAAADKSGPSNAASMRVHAISLGVPSELILVEEYGETTRQNAENTQELLRQNGIYNVILVTSPYHQRRAALEFEQQANGTVAIRNHPARADAYWDTWWWMTPSGWYLASSEIVKIIAFYLGGTR